MKLETIRHINQIIARDSKDTTYKFALLRGVIDSVHEYAHLAVRKDGMIEMPLGLLVYKWLEYYYPIMESDVYIPQKNGDMRGGKSLAFRAALKAVTDFYRDKGSISVFFSDFKKGKADSAISNHLFRLCKKIRDTITKNPMKHIGFSIYGEHYPIFQYQTKRVNSPELFDLGFLINHFGTYTFPKDYFTVFEHLGGFITGRNAILQGWADFTFKCAKNTSLSVEQILNVILKTPTDDREVYAVQKFFTQINQQRIIECVWSGKRINADMNIDHVLPFAVWKNNDLWNLLPAKAQINNHKRDKIPTSQFLQTRKEAIISYWEILADAFSDSFEREIMISLTGSEIYQNNWQLPAFAALQQKSDYLIHKRGFEPWEYLTA
jgi:hypothetical protein